MLNENSVARIKPPVLKDIIRYKSCLNSLFSIRSAWNGPDLVFTVTIADNTIFESVMPCARVQ